MAEFVHLARQPIINAENSVFGYELLYRDEYGNIDFSLTDRTMSAKVILSVYNLIGRARVVEDALAFFNIDTAFLLTDIIEALPPEQCVFEITTKRAFKLNEIAKIKYLHRLGYRFALDNFAVSNASVEMFSEVLPYIAYIKVDVQASDLTYVAAHLEPLRKNHTLIAQKVESLQEFSAYRDIGFEYFQGYYIKHPMPVKHYRLEPKQIGLNKLYDMLHTVTIAEFAREFEQQDELCIQLFQYLISASTQKLDASRSVRGVVMQVGKERLERWMMLIIYAMGNTPDVSAGKSHFLEFFQHRIELMQTIVSNVHSADPERRNDELKLLAIFSTLIDIYQIPFEAITESFHVSKKLDSWLEERKGRFTLIYKAVNQLEHTPLDIEKVNRILKSFKTDYDELSVKMNNAV